MKSKAVSEIVETRGLVVTSTAIMEDGVYYEVRAWNGDVVWQKFVEFGKSKANRAGGTAFQYASREQDRIAAKLVKERTDSHA